MRIGIKMATVLALLCALAVGVSACGGGESTAGDEGGAKALEPSEISGTVTVWDHFLNSFPGYDPAAKKQDAAFEKLYPNVTVKRVAQGFDNYPQLYKAAFAAREGADVMQFGGGVQGVLSYEDGLEVLNDRIPPEMEEHLDGWSSVTPEFAEEGERYGVPIALNAFVYFYNKDMFEKAGLPREFEPKTWDDVKQAGEKLKQAGFVPFVGGNKEGYENSNWFSTGWQTLNTAQQNAELSSGKIPYTDELVSKAFEPMIEMFDADLYAPDIFSTPLFPDGVLSFSEGKGAIFIGQWAGVMASYNDFFGPTLPLEDVGMFQPPGSKYIGIEPNFVWGMTKFAEDPDAAWAYIEFLSSKEGMQILVDEAGEISNRDDVAPAKDMPPQYYELVKTLDEYETAPVAVITVPETPTEVMRSELSEVLQGRMSLEEAQQAIQEAAERVAG